ncbi:MAG TPA: pseudouridine-5'-phosphate glycosidase [Streptosporangiales bacterium]
MTGIAVAAEVRDAVAAGVPVVALESTIFTHGLPRPRNLEVAREAEKALRAAGVVPATIGVVDGVPTVGLDDARIERLATDDAVVKISIRDLPVARAKRLGGGTTVAATSMLAHRAGVRVFATGGLGGVHHGASTTFDESADLVALASTPVVVVSAGVKSILDIAATLERLETLNIPVVGYRTTRYPGFYVADSGHRVEYAVDGPEEAAAVARARDELGLGSAVLVANPVPEADQLDPAEHDRIVAGAWTAAEREGIVGHDITPFLLDHIQRATGGRSLEVNVAVYRNNVAVAGEIARALASA